MIIVCEPQCEGVSHEKVNSGFLTLVRRTFPDQPIRVYTAPSHRDALRSILVHDGVPIDDLEFRELAVRDAYTVRGLLGYHRAFERVLRDAVDADCKELLFLSTSPVLLHVLGRLRRRPAYAHLRFAFVLHADFEDIANTEFHEVGATRVAEPSLVAKLRMIRPTELPAKVVGLVRRKLAARYAAGFKARFRTRAELQAIASDRVRFIALSPHVVHNARQYVDVDALRIHAVEMPINFAPLRAARVNGHLKLATFGYGDPGALRQVVEQLDRLTPTQPYELRIIGMDNRGLEGHPHVQCPSPGKRLSRIEMEHHAEDIDAFLILYDRGRYRLSCSGSIFEALSYVKPVFHIGNPCVAELDRPSLPIGFAHVDLEELARHVASMIDDYPAARIALAARRSNIIALRETLAMDRLVPKLRVVLR